MNRGFRVGGLAVALGMGSAALWNCAYAVASPDPREPSDSSTASAPGRAAERSVSVREARRTLTGPSPAIRSTSADEPFWARPIPVEESDGLRAASVRSTRWQAPLASDWPSDITRALTAATHRQPRGNRAYYDRGSTLGAVPVGRSLASAASASAPISGLVNVAVNPAAMPPRLSLDSVAIAFISTAVSLAVSVYHQLAIAFYLGATRPTVNQTVDINGYKALPTSIERVTAFYGPWTYGPGGPTYVQGEQQYELVDPATQETVGNFDALVSTGTPLNLGGRYIELLVIANDDVNVGTGTGEVPPVGSVIASAKVIGRWGWIYSAMPSQSDYAIAFELTTPFGNIPIPIRFNAAEGIADRTIDNRPTDLGNGFSIVPEDPDGETYTGTSGILPLFQTVQSRQVFVIRDNSTHENMGSFEGVATTTWDALGARTQAILVTQTFGGNVGTAAGQVPPVGSVYNVGYTGGGDNYVLYSSLRSISGNIVSVIKGENGKVWNVKTFPLNRLDASAPPPVRRLPVSGGYSLLPTSDLVPSGVNGLPPRDVQIQGYQQFGYYDSAGVRVGSFDAMVTSQWDWLGIHSQAILVTDVTEGTAGIASGNVPPAGSMFNYVYLGTSNFGTGYFSLMAPSGTRIRYRFLTPIINLPTWSRYDASAGLSDVELFTPFV